MIFCTYPVPSGQKVEDASHTKQRIAQLESLVLNLMEQRSADLPDVSQADSTSPSDVIHQEHTDISAPVGQLKISSGQTTSYVGDTHWEAILASVRVFPSRLT